MKSNSRTVSVREITLDHVLFNLSRVFSRGMITQVQIWTGDGKSPRIQDRLNNSGLTAGAHGTLIREDSSNDVAICIVIMQILSILVSIDLSV